MLGLTFKLASSTDAERAFSAARRQLNFMQHNTSSETFCSEMAVGSWEGTPLFNDINRAVEIVEDRMAGCIDTDSEADGT